MIASTYIRPLRVKITLADGSHWFATAFPSLKTTEQRIAQLNRLAKTQSVGATYEAATEEEYQAYKGVLS